MKRSSLGKRRLTGTLNGMRESSEGATNMRYSGKTLIPHPVKSRSSSLDRNSASVQQVMSYATPSMTPMQALVCSSVRKTPWLHGKSGSKGLKDVRPLSDKNFQMLSLQNISNYFKEIDSVLFNSVPKTSSSFTLNAFVDMSQHLFSVFYKREVINMTNYKDLIPILAKDIGYPNYPNKSWLVSANSPHYMPQVIGLLSWLVDAVKATSGVASEIMFPPVENIEDPVEIDEFSIHSSERMLQHYFECYEEFSKGTSCDHIEQKLKQEAMAFLKVTDYDFRNVNETLENLKLESEKPEVLNEIADNKKLEGIKAKLLNEIDTLERSIHDKVSSYNEYQQRAETLEHTIAQLETKKEKCILNFTEMSKRVKTQTCSPEELLLKQKRCSELEAAIKLNEESMEMWNKDTYLLDIEMSRIRSDASVVFKEYTTLIFKNIEMFPELENMKLPENMLQNDATSQTQEIMNHRERYLKNLRLDLQKKETNHDERKETVETLEQKVEQLSEKLSQETKNIEDKKRKLAVLNDKLKREKQVQIDTLEFLQNEITAINGKSSVAVLEKKILELKEDDNKVTAHIESMREEAEKYFQEIEEISKEYANKIREAVKPLFEHLGH